jgi:hypothetical protein
MTLRPLPPRLRCGSAGHHLAVAYRDDTAAAERLAEVTV